MERDNHKGQQKIESEGPWVSAGQLSLYSEAPGSQGRIFPGRMAGIEGRSGLKGLDPEQACAWEGPLIAQCCFYSLPRRAFLEGLLIPLHHIRLVSPCPVPKLRKKCIERAWLCLTKPPL